MRIRIFGFTEDYLKRTHYTHKDIITRKRRLGGYTYATEFSRKRGNVGESIIRTDDAGNSETLFTLTYKEPTSDLGRLVIFIVLCPAVYFLIVKYRKSHEMS